MVKLMGSKKLTLEVPGNSPDARHIYEKNGFKVTHEATKAESEDDVWGGLTNMEYDIDHIEHSDLTSDPSDDLEEALEQTFPELPTDVANEVWKDDIMHSNIMTESEYLEHFGIPGMKWGVRKKRSSNSESDFVRNVRKKKASELSNEELQRATTRMNLENNYASQSNNYKTNHRSAVSNVAYQIPTMLLAATVTAAVNIYAQRGAKYMSSNIDKGVATGFSTAARGITRGIAAVHRSHKHL